MALLITITVIVGILAWVFRPKSETIKDRRVAILATTLPLVTIAIAALLFQLLQNLNGGTGVSDISNTLFIAGLCLMGVAILVLLGFAFKRKSETAKGIGFGLTIMVILAIVEFVSLEALAGV